MLLHDLRLAWLSCKRTPMLTALMAGAIAVGIGASMVTISLYHARSGNPIWWKNDRLYAVTLDIRGLDLDTGRYARHPEYPPFQLSYRDAQALFRSAIPTRQAMMFKARQLVQPARPDMKPFGVMARLTTADFFSMFETPFLFGSGWTRAADPGPEAVVVLSRRTNDKLFSGVNSVGRTINLSGRSYRVVGVLDHWMPQPKFYDLNSQGFEVPEDVFMPFVWGERLELSTAGSNMC